MAIDRSIDTLAARRAGQNKTTGSLQPLPGRCGFKLTFTGTSPENPPRYCMRWPAKGKARCKRYGHGGANPRGIQRTLLYGTALPAKLRDVYAGLLDDPDLLSLKHEIAAAKAFTADVTQRVAEGLAMSTGAVGLARASLRAWQGLEAAIATRKPEPFRVARAKLLEAMQALEARLAATEQLRDAMKDFRGLALTLERLQGREHDRQDKEFNHLSLEQALAMKAAETQAFVGVLRELIPDVALQNAIRRRVAAVLAGAAPARDATALAAGGGRRADAADAATADDGRGTAGPDLATAQDPHPEPAGLPDA